MNEQRISYQTKLRIAVDQLVKGMNGKLSKADVRIIDFYLDNPVHLSSSSSELAKNINVHPSTLVRLAQKLGFCGYPELRQYLTKLVSSDDDASERHKHTKNLMEQSVLQVTIDQEIEHIKLIQSAVSQSLLDEVGNLILNANKVFICGQDNTEGFAEHFSRRLCRSGIDGRTLSTQEAKVAEALTCSNPEDVLILIFNNQLTVATERLIKIARNLQLQVVAISDVSSLTIPKDVILLRVYRGETKGTKSVSAPLVLTNAIIRNLTILAESQTLANLRQFEMIRATQK